MLRKILNKHNDQSFTRGNFKWVSCKTGELQTSLFWVILSAIHDLTTYRFCNFKWERFG